MVWSIVEERGRVLISCIFLGRNSTHRQLINISVTARSLIFFIFYNSQERKRLWKSTVLHSHITSHPGSTAILLYGERRGDRTIVEMCSRRLGCCKCGQKWKGMIYSEFLISGPAIIILLYHIICYKYYALSLLIGQNFVVQNWLNFKLLPKIFPNEKLCPPKFCPLPCFFRIRTVMHMRWSTSLFL